MDKQSEQTPQDELLQAINRLLSVHERIADSLATFEKWREEDRQERKEWMRKHAEDSKAMKDTVNFGQPKIPWQITATWVLLMLFGGFGTFMFLWDICQRFIGSQ